jgi:hypothetical protein
MSWQMPTSENPFIPPDEIDAARRDMPEDAFLQEVMAQFLEDNAGVFRNVDAVIDRTILGDEPAEVGRIYTLGVDLARYSDFTALTVLRDDGRQVYWGRYNGLPWQTQVERIANVALDYRALTVGDTTGVGDPVLEMLRAKLYELTENKQFGLDVLGYLFTNQSKRELMDAAALDIERRKVSLRAIDTQTNELKAYMYDITKSGNVVMSAPPGMHDDCVCSFALANWGRRRQGEVTLPPPDRTPIPESVRVPREELPLPPGTMYEIDEYEV